MERRNSFLLAVLIVASCLGVVLWSLAGSVGDVGASSTQPPDQARGEAIKSSSVNPEPRSNRVDLHIGPGTLQFIDQASGAGLPGVELVLIPRWARVLHDEPRVLARSDAQGHVTVPRTQSQSHLYARKRGYQSRAVQIRHLEHAETTRVIRMFRTLKAQVRVVDGARLPIRATVGISQVSLDGFEPNAGQHRPGPGKESIHLANTADASGIATFEELVPGTYDIRVYTPGLVVVGSEADPTGLPRKLDGLQVPGPIHEVVVGRAYGAAIRAEGDEVLRIACAKRTATGSLIAMAQLVEEAKNRLQDRFPESHIEVAVPPIPRKSETKTTMTALVFGRRTGWVSFEVPMAPIDQISHVRILTLKPKQDVTGVFDLRVRWADGRRMELPIFKLFRLGPDARPYLAWKVTPWSAKRVPAGKYRLLVRYPFLGNAIKPREVVVAQGRETKVEIDIIREFVTRRLHVLDPMGKAIKFPNHRIMGTGGKVVGIYFADELSRRPLWFPVDAPASVRVSVFGLNPRLVQLDTTRRGPQEVKIVLEEAN